VRWTKENLARVRGVILAVVAALILVAYLISRLHGS